MNNRLFSFLFWICLINLQFAEAQDLYPQQVWQKITNLEQVGWSTMQLDEAKATADSIGSDAVLIIYKGAILKAWGEIERKFMCHSMRKSILSAVIGLHVDDGKINLNQTLSKIGIDDSVNPLTEQEKSATIEHLLASRSGIYLPAAYEWPTRKPRRGKFKPGENWFYPNNWDYNALLSIYEKLTGEKLFEDFYNSLAVPLSMQDYEVSDGYYHYEKNKSVHPAYPFRMSARDLARLGLLFLRNGRWEDKQIISTSWITKSTSPISQTYAKGEGYGLLWWVDKKNFKYDYYSAEGTGGHGLIVIPDLELVIIHRTNTFIDKRISYKQRGKLIEKIMEAYVGNPIQNELQLEEYVSSAQTPKIDTSNRFNLQPYVGLYHIQKLNDYESDTVRIYLNQADQLEIFIPYKGYFSLLPITKELFTLEDSKEFISFVMNGDGIPEKIVYHRNSRVGKKDE